MARIWSTELAGQAGARVELAGWLHRFRRLSRVSFLILRDGRGLAQIVVEDAALVERLAALPNESVLRVTGEAVANPQAPGGIEVRGPTVEIVSVPSEPPPFDLDEWRASRSSRVSSRLSRRGRSRASARRASSTCSMSSS